ncbi:MAG: phage terminase large subunit [Isosphaeraceae bacterium]
MRQEKLRHRDSLRSFIELINPGQPPARHHRLLIDRLEAVERGDIKRLMVFMPPGSAKSTYASVFFPAWFLGRNPQKNVIAASYAVELAEKFGRRVRGIVASDEWRGTFDNGLSKESASAGRWALESGGEYYAVGLRGGITGFRADLGIIDDPVKSREEAESPTIRDKTKDAYRQDFWTRLKPGAAVILIMTRWHGDDLGGYLLDEMNAGGEKWDVLSLPMLAESSDPLGRAEGEPLWPEWFTEDMLAEARRDSRMWASLYQQRPAPAEGGIFKAEWFRRYAAPQDHYAEIVQSWDTGIKVKELSDPSVCTTWGIRPDGYDLLHVAVGKLEYPDLKAKVVRQAADWKPTAILIEDKASGQQLIQDFRRETVLPVIGIMPKHDKIIRANGVSAMVEAGKVFFPQHAPWLTDFEMEMLQFPNAVHDDRVDSTTQFLEWQRLRASPDRPLIRRL